MKAAASFYNSRWRYRWYELTRSFYLRGREGLVQEAANLLPFDPQQPIKVLDLGCGTGWMMQQLAYRFPAATLYGVESSFGMLSMAYQRMIPHSQRTQFFTDIRSITAPYDLVVCSYTLSQLDEKALVKALACARFIAVVDFAGFTPAGQAIFEVNGEPYQNEWLAQIRYQLHAHFRPIRNREYPGPFGLFNYFQFLGESR